MNTVWIIGDSFSYVNPHDHSDKIWTTQIANRLDYTLYNESLPGTSQDWAWRLIANYQDRITSDDQLIITLTHPSRFWFFEDRPDAANHDILDFDKIINDDEKVKAARYFIQHIQRPELDIQLTDHRMGWLSYLVEKYKWRKPIILLGFPQLIYQDLYPNLIFSNGALLHISKNEYLGNIEHRGRDCRYNHMCLSNHTILVDKLVNTLKTGADLDLTNGFNEKIYRKELLDNADLSKDELSIIQLREFQSMSKAEESWLTRFKSK